MIAEYSLFLWIYLTRASALGVGNENICGMSWVGLGWLWAKKRCFSLKGKGELINVDYTVYRPRIEMKA